MLVIVNHLRTLIRWNGRRDITKISIESEIKSNRQKDQQRKQVIYTSKESKYLLSVSNKAISITLIKKACKQVTLQDNDTAFFPILVYNYLLISCEICCDIKHRNYYSR